MPPLVIGVEADGKARAYDWEQLQKKKLIVDELGATPLLVLSADDGSSAFIYDRRVAGETLDFTRRDDVCIDTKTRAQWNQFGQCVAGDMIHTQLKPVQSYQQFLRSWGEFHPHTDFYDFKTIDRKIA